MKIKQVMSHPALTCRSTDSLDAAARMMWDHDIGVVPVVNTKGALEGMITDRDVCMSALTKGRTLHAIPISDAMSKKVYSCKPTDSLDAAERLMRDKQVRRVPVVDEDNIPLGILSLNDIARYAAENRKKDGLDREVTQTLAAICQPRTPGKSKKSVASAARR